jgi:hydrogenase expression/formation protein HypC
VSACADGHCVTCSDEGIPMRVLRLDDARGLALCEDGDGARSSVEIALVDRAAVGDTLLVHAGTALLRLTVAA